MAPQVKLLANGIKAVLTAQRGSKPGLLQVFDKDNCMIAHREVLSKVNKQGERTLEKLTLRDNKYMDQQIEYLETTTRKDGSWSSSRTVDIYGDCYINYNDIKSGKKSVDYYKEVIEGQHLDVHQCMMVGNDVKEDGAIQTLGVPLFLVEDYMLNHDNLEINCKWKGSSLDFLKFVEELPEVK